MSLGTPGEMTKEKLKAPSVDYRAMVMYFATCKEFVIVVCCSKWLPIYSSQANIWVRLILVNGGWS